MQMEMEIGGSKLLVRFISILIISLMGNPRFFDLFVAMCNHVDDIVEIRYVYKPSLAVSRIY